MLGGIKRGEVEVNPCDYFGIALCLSTDMATTPENDLLFDEVENPTMRNDRCIVVRADESAHVVAHGRLLSTPTPIISLRCSAFLFMRFPLSLSRQ